MPKIIVYSSNSCPFCVLAKDFLKKNNVIFEEKNRDKDAAARQELLEKSGQLGVPVILIKAGSKETVIVGFQIDKIKKALNLK